MRVVTFIVFTCINGCRSQSDNNCGVERSSSSDAYEERVPIERYPWLGLLIYQFGAKSQEEPLTATVVLITRQLALATAMDIDKYPKIDFRRNSRVVLGSNCSGPYIEVLEYVFHPEYRNNYYSALAIVQLKSSAKLRRHTPICAPPEVFQDSDIYAMTLTHECSSSMVSIYKMQYVSLDECKDYYRRNNIEKKYRYTRYNHKSDRRFT